jgi:3-deoxy-D-manno-octulosonic-acid transferase
VRPLSLQLYRLATGMLSPLVPALLSARARRGKEDPARLSERLGHPGASRPPGRLIWLHGASVGESLSLLPLVGALRAKRSDVAILVTSGTVTSAALMAQRLPPSALHQYAPIDTPGAGARFLAHWSPNLAVFVESELWPNLILDAQANGSRLALLSARLSDASLAGWARLPAAAKTLFAAFDRVMAQDDAIASALTRLGARDDGRLNLKRLGAAPDVELQALDALRGGFGDRPVLLAASTHPGEDEIVLDAFRALAEAARLVIVPRHPARAADISALAQSRGFSVGLRSRGEGPEAGEVYIADTLGELGLWFSLAKVALIGGGLLPGPGGHNPIESAQLGCPVLAGPYVDNWRTVYADLAAADAARTVRDAGELSSAFAAALADPAAMTAQAERARHVVAVDGEALNAVAEVLISLIP